MLRPESKTRILENFYAIDYILFGKQLKKMNFKCGDLVKEYISVKAALLSTMVEMLSLVNHQPKKITEQIDNKDLTKMAKKSAKIARENCQKLVKCDKARDSIKADLRESLEKNPNVNIDEFVQNKIREKAFSLAVDNLLIARTITESKNYKALNAWEGKIVEDAYKVLREQLIETATKLLYDCEKKTEKCDCSEEYDKVLAESILNFFETKKKSKTKSQVVVDEGFINVAKSVLGGWQFKYWFYKFADKLQRTYMSCEEYCKGRAFSEGGREKCRIKCSMSKTREQIEALNKLESKCMEKKNPKKCKIMVQNEVKNLEGKLKKLKNKMKQFIG